MYFVYRERDGISFPFTAFPFLYNATELSIVIVPTVTRERERDSGDGWLLTRSWIQSGLEEGGLRWREKENNKELLLLLQICLSAQKLSDAATTTRKTPLPLPTSRLAQNPDPLLTPRPTGSDEWAQQLQG